MTLSLPSPTSSLSSDAVAIVGGGLAGMSAAASLAEHGVPVVLYEARRRTGGRAGSFQDASSGNQIDYCQHVAMGCCTNLLALLRRTRLLDRWQRHDRLRFLDPEGRISHIVADPLPAPLHLVRSLLAVRFLNLRDRLATAAGLLRLMRLPSDADGGCHTFRQWLDAHRQSPAAQARFWQPIIESALGQSLDHVAVTAARKVFVDGFAAHRDAFRLYIPTQPLAQLFGECLPAWLQQHGVEVRCSCPVQRVECTADGVDVVAAGTRRRFPHAILAVPWHQLGRIAPERCGVPAARLQAIEQFPASSIAGIHLWFDRPITDLQHVVFVDRFCQWLFAGKRDPNDAGGNGDPLEYYCQVVISSAAAVQRTPRHEVASRVLDELREALPDAANAQLRRYRVVVDPQAVFSVTASVERQRPPTRTDDPRILLAGDYTASGWPATMEGAVISGAAAAEAILAAHGRAATCIVPPLPRASLARWLIRS